MSLSENCRRIDVAGSRSRRKRKGCRTLAFADLDSEHSGATGVMLMSAMSGPAEEGVA